MTYTYEQRLKSLRHFIDIKAPKSVILFSIDTLLLGEYKGSYFRVAWHFIRTRLWLFRVDLLDSIKTKFYSLYLNEEEIEKKLFPEMFEKK